MRQMHKSMMRKLSFSQIILGTGIFMLLLGWGWPAVAQSLTLNMGEPNDGLAGRAIQLFLMMTVLSLAPSIVIMLTSFVRIVVVLSLLRTAMGTQQTPPNVVLTSLAMFLTFFIMQPVLEKSWTDGVTPYIEGQMEEREAFDKAIAPFHKFMREHTRQKDLELFISLSRMAKPESAEAIPLRVLIPAFMISELRRAFEIGFMLFMPFLIIEMVVSSILMSMGMMMLPPVLISTPFKIIFFVLVDGWNLVAGSLVQSYGITALPP